MFKALIWHPCIETTHCIVPSAADNLVNAPAALVPPTSALASQQQYAKHTLLRSSVEEVLCLTGTHTQPLAAGAYCQSCGSCFGEYACTQCAFFDSNEDAGCWHCSDCGICRRGGQSNFFHCSGCGCCLRKDLQVSVDGALTVSLTQINCWPVAQPRGQCSARICCVPQLNHGSSSSSIAGELHHVEQQCSRAVLASNQTYAS